MVQSARRPIDASDHDSLHIEDPSSDWCVRGAEGCATDTELYSRETVVVPFTLVVGGLLGMQGYSAFKHELVIHCCRDGGPRACDSDFSTQGAKGFRV
jgi:hypothetical protein